MNNKTAKTLYIIGSILLGLLFVFSCLLSFGFFSLCGLSGTPEIYNDCIRSSLIYAGIQSIVLITSFFLARKYPLIGGAILLGIGTIIAFGIIMTLNPDYVFYYGIFNIDYSYSPVALFFLVDGLLFLISGFIRRRNKPTM